MNCFTCERNLSAYLDDELPMDERIELESHLDACEICRAEFESHQMAWEMAHQVHAEAAPEGLWEGIADELPDDHASTSGVEDLTLMVKGLAAEIQELRRTVDSLRRDLHGAVSSEVSDPFGREPAESIRVRGNPFRPGEPREASIDQLRRSS